MIYYKGCDGDCANCPGCPNDDDNNKDND